MCILLENEVISMLFKKSIYNYRQEKTFPSLGTINTIIAFGKNSEEAINAASERVLQINDKMSAFKNGSDIVKINLSAGKKAERIDKDTFDLLKRSLEFSRLSKGAFDITVRPLTALWAFGKNQNYVPSKEEIEKVLPLVNYEDLQLDDKSCTAYLKKEGQAIDLGGIAKGYAADEVKRILLQHKIKNALINLGGNIVTLGSNPEGKDWCIGIQNPMSSRGQYIGSITATNQTIVTSGSYEQFFIKDGIRYHHILDPRTGYPANTKLLSVTAICENSTAADALTTAIFVSGVTEAVPLLKSENAQAIFIMENQDVFVTEGLQNNFKRI